MQLSNWLKSNNLECPLPKQQEYPYRSWLCESDLTSLSLELRGYKKIENRLF